MSLPTSTHPFLITGNDANQYKIANSLRFRASNSAYLSRTPGSASSRTTWTLSFWVKRGLLGDTSTMFGAGNSATGGGAGFAIGFNTSNQFRFSAGGGVTFNYLSTPLFRDPSAWYHFVVVWDSTNATTTNRIRVWFNNNQITSWATQSSPSQNTTIDWNNTTTNYVGAENDAGSIVRLDGYMAEIHSIDGQTLTPSSFGQTDPLTNQWVPKQYTGTYGTNGFYLPFKDNSSTTTLGYDVTNGTGALTTPYAASITTNNSGWDTLGVRMLLTTGAIQQQGKSFRITLKSGSNGLNIQGVKFGVKASSGNAWDFTGDQVSVTFGGATTYSLGSNSTLTSDWMVYPSIINPSSDYILALAIGTTNGTTLSGSATTGSIRNYTKAGDYNSGALTTAPTGYSDAGTAAYFLTALEVQGNNWTPSGISVTSGVTYDVMRDSPTAYDDGSNIYNRGNYAVLNPVGLPGVTPTNGNLFIPAVAGVTYYNVRSTMALPTTGQYYWEATWGTAQYASAGIWGTNSTWSSSGTDYIGGLTYQYALGELGYSDFRTFTNAVNTATGITVAANAIIGISFDASASKIWFAVNGTWVNSGNPASGTSPAYTVTSDTYFPAFSVRGNESQSINFGQRPFSYTPPAGFKALNSFNLPNPSLPLV